MLCVEKIDIYKCLLNIYSNQTVNVSIIRWKVMHFSCGDSNVTQLSTYKMKNALIISFAKILSVKNELHKQHLTDNNAVVTVLKSEA